MAVIRTLSEMLADINSEKWDYALFVKGEHPWAENAPCAALDPDDSDDPEADPPFAVQNGLRYALTVQDVRGIVDNLRQQKPDATPGEVVKAFNFYFRNDAFIEAAQLHNE